MHVICPKQKVWNTKEDEHKTQRILTGFPLTALEVLCPIIKSIMPIITAGNIARLKYILKPLSIVFEYLY